MNQEQILTPYEIKNELPPEQTNAPKAIHYRGVNIVDMTLYGLLLPNITVYQFLHTDIHHADSFENAKKWVDNRIENGEM